MIVISGNIVLQSVEAAELFNKPLVGWHNVITAAGVTADTAAANYPGSNLANPATNLEWRAADTSEQYITFDISYVDAIDYVGIAKHNFGSAGIPVSIEGFKDEAWTEIVGEITLPDDTPAMFQFAANSYSQVRIRLQSGGLAARAAVVYVGKLLVMERKIYVGHTPMPHARQSNITSARSETGNFLGRIVLGEWRETTVPLSLISAAWYRAYMDPFLAAAKEVPFFFAWRPNTYPREVGFGWLIEDPLPTPQGPSNRLSLELHVSGVA